MTGFLDSAKDTLGLKGAAPSGGKPTNAFFCLRVPPELVDALVNLQQDCHQRVDPQHPEHIHITLGFLHNADKHQLEQARRLVDNGTWTAPPIRLTGDVRHASWTLANNPGYRHDEQVVQKGEQVRLGVEHSPELARIQEEITRTLNIVEDGFWPHVTLGLAREDFPTAEIKALKIPSLAGPAPSVDMQKEVSATEFTTLARNHLTPA
ncbi:2'-5' RNA ligase family protein [Streptomyces sp. NPDC007369]|uniref:2'-5' RNA ligase family protein n=1 Tax=Streptomyces sp. NPDC007369 TaxID=3154589 RepID=UPI0033C47768